MDKPLLVFDGVCVLCSRILRPILWADQNKKRLNYATTQSDVGQKYLKEFGYDTETFHTVLLIMPDGTHYIKSDTIAEIARIMGGPWHLLRVLKIFPKSWRNALYDFVAKRRYKWFGKSDYCERIPQKYSDRITK